MWVTKQLLVHIEFDRRKKNTMEVILWYLKKKKKKSWYDIFSISPTPNLTWEHFKNCIAYCPAYFFYQFAAKLPSNLTELGCIWSLSKKCEGEVWILG